MSLIEVSHVSREFKSFQRPEGLKNALYTLFKREYEYKMAVDDVSFSIEKGELVGYIGPNGAGKSTTIKMLSGILVPSSGTVMTGGIVPWEQRKKNASHIGVVFGQRSQLNWDLPMEDTFELYRRMYRIDNKTYCRNVDMFVELLEMQQFLRKPVRQLSLGQKMRAELAVALLHDPSILYLDEPTIGLDVVVKDKIRKFIRSLNQEKKTTVILTTHDMDDIEEICNRIIMIDHGKLVLDQTVHDFKIQGTDHYYVELSFSANQKPLTIPGVLMVKEQAACHTYQVDSAMVSFNLLLRLLSDSYDVTDITINKPEIDEIVRRLYKRTGEREESEKLLHIK
ncbi:ABC transporter ATP-binding protein [Lacrimispora aerotolerans]|uniref:ABC transporter ATP-binding protein n=1 Tax=Lacrimispora aerotolerans TaxID=36832 RepID=UPI00047C85F6|nr:ATP-binding cassette domain-containing protein [Lacrimispora aerotolerans]